jgi:MoxR-like ATPase
MEEVEAQTPSEESRLSRASVLADRFTDNIETVVYGKREEIRLVLAALLCGGHVLFEDVPGTAKTVLARAIAGTIEGTTTTRIQCTPDLQPTDVTGLSVFNPKERDFEFRPGPIFANIVLVDEINRAMPKTQSALLEAMAERQVTVDGETRPLPDPFLLLATENPIEYEGTFPLPEAQLDRFFLKTALGYPVPEDEVRIIHEQRAAHPLASLEPAIDLEELAELRRGVQDVYVDPLLARWIVDLVRTTREAEGVTIGASVRGSLSLERAARAWALLHGRSYVVPDDVERLLVPVLVHRIVFAPAFLADARKRGWRTAIHEFVQACVAAAPRPAPAVDGRFAPRRA